MSNEQIRRCQVLFWPGVVRPLFSGHLELIEKKLSPLAFCHRAIHSCYNAYYYNPVAHIGVFPRLHAFLHFLI